MLKAAQISPRIHLIIQRVVQVQPPIARPLFAWSLRCYHSSSLHHGPLNDEVERAKEAATARRRKYEPTIFSKIINKEIPAKIVHEDDKVCTHKYRKTLIREH